jgi:maleate cis-trans isomerase
MAAHATTQPKVGLMVPINNTTMERELLAWLPAGSVCTTLRIPRDKGLLTPEAMPAYTAQAISLAAAFAESDINIVAYGCTAAGFIAGPAGGGGGVNRVRDVLGVKSVLIPRELVKPQIVMEGKL